MTELKAKQIQFAHMLGQLLCYASSRGISLVIDWGYRPPDVAEQYAAKGIGIKDSLHTLRLAQDLVVVDGDGKPNWGTDAYRELGEFWESLGGAWGGRFRVANGGYDSGHFSLEYRGRK